ncbi:MAG: MoxR family ATPase [Lentisphaeria bacterium]|jgi:MoxR-like ATPase|nr:MoxR family ATPase [Lentisphaeria bacterium]MDP7743781.1 MoxR family ATPase [Lentisphaeria bacterium]
MHVDRPATGTAINQSLHDVAEALRHNLASVILGKEEAINQVMIALFSSGNILLEDVPGVGKTTLAKALARSLDAEYNRIQFTPDLLPADILGSSIFNPQTGQFTFRKGPVFTNILLADEINRASPRTQSALLEAMTEQQATIEGVRHPLDAPFVVVATQNPIEYHGTYPLPEAQLDRFAMRLDLGYPNAENELEILYAQRQAQPLENIHPIAGCNALLEIQRAVREIGVERSVGQYIVDLATATRNDPRIRLGASPRASLMYFRAAQARAFIQQREYVVPDDVKSLAVAILSHRIVLDSKARYKGQERAAVVNDIVSTVSVPL